MSISGKYRPEIDGLRALAILPVIFFHAGFEIFRGGFLGVDVFFVISGYLITSFIISDLSSNNFRLLDFYERRARRILPALLTMCIFITPISFFILLPGDQINFAKSIIASIFFVSNVLFWRETGYFDVESELKPLMHTWSLSVEEQFYIFFPLVLIFIWRFKQSFIAIPIFILLIISFALSNWGAFYKPAANFYLLPTRGWEIMSGALCAVYLSNTKFNILNKVKPCLDNVFSSLGLFLIIFSIFSFDSNSPMPSYYSLPIIVGTTLIILFCNNQTITYKMLSMKPFIFAGLISYSLYLWHQPILALHKYMSLNEPSTLSIIFSLLIAFLMAVISWQFIEQPFRDRIRITRHALVKTLLLASSILLISSTLIIIKNKNVAYSDDSIDLKNYFQPNTGIKELECNSTSIERCISDSQSRMILWGDSYAMHLSQAIFYSPTSLPFKQVTKNSCAPILNLSNTIKDVAFADECINFNKKVFNSIIQNPNIRIVVLSSTFYFPQGKLVKVHNKFTNDLADKEIINLFKETVRALESSGKKVVIISPTPSIGSRSDPARCSVNAITRNKDLKICDFSRRSFSTKTKNGYKLLKSMQEDINILWIDQLICEINFCFPYIDNFQIYRDNGHLSISGSRLLGEKYDIAGLILLRAKSENKDF